VELMRSSLMLVVDVNGRSDELKCAAFMFLKVSLPATLSHFPFRLDLESLEKSGNLTLVGEKSGKLWFACDVLLELR